MDETRMFVVQSVQRARAQTFDGPPFEPWARPGAHSLPPPPDPPKKAVKTKSISRTAMSERTNMERVITPSGKAKWVLAAKIIAEVQRRITAGYPLKSISKDTGVSLNAVHRISRELRGIVPVSLPVVVATVVTLNVIEQPTLEYQEPQRTFVIDWKSRLAAIEFEGEPGKGKPRKGRSQSKCSSADYRNVYPWPHLYEPTCINPSHAFVPSTQLRNTQPSSNYFAGAKDFESQWRTTCTR